MGTHDLTVQEIAELKAKGCHAFVNSDVTKFDSNCSVCDGKQRDSVHGFDDVMRERWAVTNTVASMCVTDERKVHS